MVKKAQKQAPEIKDLVNVNLVVPPETAKKYGTENLNLQLNAPVIEYGRRFVDELKLSRRIPNDPSDITMADPLALWILSTEPNLDGAAVLHKAEHYYGLYLIDVQREAFVLAMAMFNEAPLLEPEPYPTEERKEILRDKGGVPSWLAQIPEVPPVNKPLEHQYERRLKQIMDLLEAGGKEDPLFLASFNRVINNDLTKKLREMGVSASEPTDDDNFPEKPSGS